jgi:hypothetical protein
LFITGVETWLGPIPAKMKEITTVLPELSIENKLCEFPFVSVAVKSTAVDKVVCAFMLNVKSITKEVV